MFKIQAFEITITFSISPIHIYLSQHIRMGSEKNHNIKNMIIL